MPPAIDTEQLTKDFADGLWRARRVFAARGWIGAESPTDPAGVPFVLDPAADRNTVSERSPCRAQPAEPVSPRPAVESPTS